jgi:hypothetical protein
MASGGIAPGGSGSIVIDGGVYFPIFPKSSKKKLIEKRP